MCYFIYSGVNEGINNDDLTRYQENEKYTLISVSEEEFRNSVENENEKYRLNQHMCDCNSAFGSRQIKKKEIDYFVEYLKGLSKIKGIEHIFFIKKWLGDSIVDEEIVHINDIDIVLFFSEIEENCLYKIQLYKKYY